MYLVLLALHSADKMDDLLDSWEATGITGATVLPSTGLGRIRRNHFLREDMPLLPSMEDLFSPAEDLSHTIFTVVENQKTVDALVKATRDVLGDLDQPDTGILIILPVAQAYGLGKASRSGKRNAD